MEKMSNFCYFVQEKMGRDGESNLMRNLTVSDLY